MKGWSRISRKRDIILIIRVSQRLRRCGLNLGVKSKIRCGTVQECIRRSRQKVDVYVAMRLKNDLE